ncbi:MAG: hypothetical protein QW040_03050 [Candidatus Aenigmatarchaeota archaeon]
MKWYGLFGLSTMIFAEAALYFRIPPFTSFFCPLIWLGYIVFVDNIVFYLKKDSLLTKHPKKTVSLFILSVIFWLIFEVYNHFIQGWRYLNISELEVVAGVVAFATIIPAVFETAELIKSLHLFDKIKTPKLEIIANKKILQFFVVIGVLFLILPFFFSRYWWAWTMVWTGFFFLLDPINYLNGEPSIIKDIKNRKWKIPLSFALAGLVCGFIWEWWNWRAVARWEYVLPGLPLGEIKIFEMPILGYLGYPLFAWELYAMCHFAFSVLKKREGKG